VLARTVEDRALGDELRAAARRIALALGRWNGADSGELADIEEHMSAS